MHYHLPGWSGPAAAVLFVVLVFSGPVRRHWRRLAVSLLAGLAAAAAVTGWADKTRHAQLAAHKASVAWSLVPAFIVITVAVTVAGLVIGAVRARARRKPELTYSYSVQPAGRVRSGNRS